MQRKILNELHQHPQSKVYEPMKTTLAKLITKIQNDKNLSGTSRQMYLRVVKEIDWGMGKIQPYWPHQIQRMLDNLKSSLQDFDKTLNETAKGSSLFCGSSTSSKSLQPIYRQILSYQQIFPVIGVYQDKKLKEEVVNKVIDIVQKQGIATITTKSQKSIKNDQSPIKQQQIKIIAKSQKCQYCQLYLASTIIPNGFIVKKLLKQLPDTEWISGVLYQEGKILDKDLSKAIKCYQTARKKNNSQAIYRLGLLNQSDKYGSPNQYLKMWRQAAGMGHLQAMTDLGFLYQNGLEDQQSGRVIIEANPEKALSYYNEAAKSNFPRALNNLASFYYNNQTHKNSKKCIEYFEKAIQSEYVKSFHNLGLLYFEGQIVNQNIEKSISLIKRSAQKGDIQGKLLYCEMVLNDPQKFSQQQLVQINRYCRQVIAADQQCGSAYYFMGLMYQGGYGVMQQPKTALLYYTKSARYQYPNAYIKLGQCYRNGFGIEQDLRQAVRYYQKAKDTCPQVYVYLGQVYEKGSPDLPANSEMAFNYYYNACNLGVSQGFQALGMMYKNGKTVNGRVDLQKAEGYFKKARQLKKKPNKLSSSNQLIQSSYFRSNKK